MTEVLSYVTKEDMMAASVNPALMTHHATTTMPCVQLHVGTNEQGTGPAVVRSACLDTGCNLNLISRRAMESDIHLFGDDVTLHKIKPFTIQFADGRSTTDSHYAIEKAQVVLGTCSYEVNFIVMENLTTDYMLGFPFMWEYNVSLRPQANTMSIGVVHDNWFGSVKRNGTPPAYQIIPIQFKTKLLEIPVQR